MKKTLQIDVSLKNQLYTSIKNLIFQVFTLHSGILSWSYSDISLRLLIKTLILINIHTTLYVHSLINCQISFDTCPVLSCFLLAYFTWYFTYNIYLKTKNRVIKKSLSQYFFIEISGYRIVYEWKTVQELAK